MTGFWWSWQPWVPLLEKENVFKGPNKYCFLLLGCQVGTVKDLVARKEVNPGAEEGRECGLFLGARRCRPL